MNQNHLHLMTKLVVFLIFSYADEWVLFTSMLLLFLKLGIWLSLDFVIWKCLKILIKYLNSETLEFFSNFCGIWKKKWMKVLKKIKCLECNRFQSIFGIIIMCCGKSSQAFTLHLNQFNHNKCENNLFGEALKIASVIDTKQSNRTVPIWFVDSKSGNGN